MKYLVGLKNENGQVAEIKEFTSIKQIAEALDCTTSAVRKNFRWNHYPCIAMSKKSCQILFEKKYTIMAKKSCQILSRNEYKIMVKI